MTKNLLLLSYWFPPNNVIGASRAFAIAKHFSEKGWKVTVICVDSNSVSKDFSVDLSSFDIYRIPDTWLTQFLNFKLGRSRLVRVLSALVRVVSLPDGLRSTTKQFEKIAEKIGEDRQFDVILSTALPFSQHAVACRIAQKTDTYLVLDNRDAWACNTYRRRLPFSCWLEKIYERRVLSNADLISTISDGMSEHYRNTHPNLSARIRTVRNGVDHSEPKQAEPLVDSSGRLRIVYTGILYGEKRDITPALEAASRSGLPVSFDFYGSESDQIQAFKAKFPKLDIVDNGRVSREKALDAQKNASVLMVALGKDPSEKTFLPGKFFEYVGSGRPIIVLADEDYEICQIVRKYELGIGTRDAKLITSYLEGISSAAVAPRNNVPSQLTRSYQLDRLESEIVLSRS
ncbi:glycosyltransferase [uncultured Shimia sp.]|uniref:glycosyltransferase n=1 Tax=uncultured Shimia sp. TaxID=573152 RepID=UPI002622DE5D|nr:glycosyltransferase [uncultured Shimia sp.]